MKKILFIFALIMVCIAGFTGANHMDCIILANGLFGAPVLRDLYFKQVSENPNLIITPSSLRLEQTIQDSISNYSFDPVNGGGFGSEIKLNNNDAFVITHLGMFIGFRIAAKEGKTIKLTYPNAAWLTSVTPSSFDYTDLWTLYNGYLQINVDKTTYLDNLLTAIFKMVPQAQKGVIVSEAVTSATPTPGSNDKNQQLNDQWDQGQGFIQLPCFPKLNGQSKNEIKLNFETYSGIKWQHDGSGVTNQLIVEMLGFLIQQGAVPVFKAGQLG